jgi:DNA-binding NarL/FixJ family response regulator
MPRVLIADSDPTSRNAINLWLIHKMGIEGITEVYEGDCLLERLSQGETDVVLMDWSLPGRPDAERFRKIRETHPDLVLVLLSEKAEVAAEAEDYAATFIHKSIAPAELLAALQPLFESFTNN